MEYKELLKKTPSELNSLLLEYRSELFTLRFKNQSSNLDQTHKISQIRKIIARILTILSEQKLAQSPKPKNSPKSKKKHKKSYLQNRQNQSKPILMHISSRF